MSDETTPQDSAAMSPASDGSVGWRSSVDIRVRLLAWRDNPHFRALGCGSFGTKAADDVAEAADDIARLRLTDAEREAIYTAAMACEDLGYKALPVSLRDIVRRLR